MRIVIPILLLCVVLVVRPVAAQAVPSPTPAPAEQTFVSVDGGFRIDLPTRTNSGSPLRPVAGESTGGSIWTWKLPDGRQYQAAFVDRILAENAKATFLDHLADELAAEMSKNGQTLLERRPFKIKEYDAMDVRFTVDSGTALTRYILVNKRLFILTTAWPLGKVSESYVKPFDSFDLIDRKAAIAKIIEQASPADLPQTPRMKMASTDAKMERLRGKVKLVTVSKKLFEGEGGIIQDQESYFDEHGNLVKIVSFDHRGNPRNVDVYGFIDGKRVKKTGAYLSYEYDPPPPPPMRAPPPPSAAKGSVATAPPSGVKGSAATPPPLSVYGDPPKKADKRYGVEYTFKFDAQDRLIEKVSLYNTGDMFWRTTYRPDRNSEEKTDYTKEGKLVSRSVTEFDDRGNEMKSTSYSTNANYPDDSVTEYRYLKFDRKGNWIEREVTGKTGRYKGGTDSFRYVENREITYH